MADLTTAEHWFTLDVSPLGLAGELVPDTTSNHRRRTRCLTKPSQYEHHS